MNGLEFFRFLMLHYTLDGQTLYGNYSFCRWVQKPDNTFNFQFNLLRQKKTIPQSWLIDAKNAKNEGEVITREWFNRQYGQANYNDCRASVAMWLLENN